MILLYYVVHDDRSALNCQMEQKKRELNQESGDSDVYTVASRRSLP